jgi:hypothetical protein
MQVLTRMTMSTMNILRLNLAADDPTAREQLAETVTSLLAAGIDRPRLSVTLTGEDLPAPLIASLVAGLRRLREVGGAIAVDPATPAVRDAFALHGLDRVFAFPLEELSHRNRGAGINVGRFASAAFLAIVAFLGRAPADAQQLDTTDPQVILGRVIDRNPNLSSFQGRLHVDVRMTSFPFLRQHLDGTTFYKRPSNYEVVFDHVPSYAHGFEKLYTDIGDPASWDKHFVITYEGETTYENHRDVALRMVQRVRGMIDHETVLVDAGSWTIDQIRYDYYNGGHITMSQEFRPVGGYLLLASQKAEIVIPHIRAVAQGSYSDYQTNVALDDTLFTGKN